MTGVPAPPDQAALLRLRRVRLVRKARRTRLAHRRAVLLRSVVSR